jgi:hypothetical protein
VDKTAAEKEALRLWRALPLQQRLHFKQAIAFAAMIGPMLEFETLGDHDKIVQGWLVRDLMRAEELAKRAEKQTPKPTKAPPLPKDLRTKAPERPTLVLSKPKTAAKR